MNTRDWSAEDEREGRRLFRQVYEGDANVMTPHTVEYGTWPGGAYEIARGEGLTRNVMYGLSVVARDRVTGEMHSVTSTRGGLFYKWADVAAAVRRLREDT